jgi:hypothetical protein
MNRKKSLKSDIANQSTDNPESETPIKKKRGRPRKADGDVKPKKKRGRPKKTGTYKRKKSAKTNYHLLQYALKKYTKERVIHLGLKFNTVASTIWKDVPHDANLTIDYFDKHIHSYYRKVSNLKLPKRDFPDDVPFFMINDEISSPSFSIEDNILMDIYDQGMQFTFEGNFLEFQNWFRDVGLLKHCREHYNNSPYAILRVEDTDSETWVKYTLANTELTPILAPASKEEKKGAVEVPAGVTIDELSGLTPEGKKEVLLEREKTKQKELEFKSKEQKLKDLKELLKDKIITFDQYNEALKSI